MRSRLTTWTAAAGLVAAMCVSVPTIAGVAAPAAAAPASATDATKVPHYFGPWPNWANSPYTSSTATVTFTDPAGTGTGAVGTATVDPTNGAITGVDLTSPATTTRPGRP